MTRNRRRILAATVSATCACAGLIGVTAPPAPASPATTVAAVRPWVSIDPGVRLPTRRTRFVVKTNTAWVRYRVILPRRGKLTVSPARNLRTRNGTVVIVVGPTVRRLDVYAFRASGGRPSAWARRFAPAIRPAPRPAPTPEPSGPPADAPVLRGFEFIPDATTCYLEPQIDKYSAFSGLFARVRFAIRVDKTDPDTSVVVAAPAFGGHFTDFYQSGSLYGDVPHTSDPVTRWFVQGVPVTELPVTISSLTFTTQALGLNTTPSAPMTLTAPTPLTIDTSACTDFVPPTAPAAVALEFVRGSGGWAQLQVNWQKPVGGLWAEGTWSPVNSYTAVVTGSDGSSQTVGTRDLSHALNMGYGHFVPGWSVAVPEYHPGVTYTAVGYASNGAGTSPPSAPVRVTVPADAPPAS